MLFRSNGAVEYLAVNAILCPIIFVSPSERYPPLVMPNIGQPGIRGVKVYFFSKLPSLCFRLCISRAKDSMSFS